MHRCCFLSRLALQPNRQDLLAAKLMFVNEYLTLGEDMAQDMEELAVIRDEHRALEEKAYRDALAKQSRVCQFLHITKASLLTGSMPRCVFLIYLCMSLFFLYFPDRLTCSWQLQRPLEGTPLRLIFVRSCWRLSKRKRPKTYKNRSEWSRDSAQTRDLHMNREQASLQASHIARSHEHDSFLQKQLGKGSTVHVCMWQLE